MALEALGDLVLQVGADLSPLESTLEAIPGVAQQAGAAIDQALGSALDGATASLENLNAELANVGSGAGGGLQQLDAAIKDTGESAATANPHIEDLGHGVEHAGASAHEAGGHFEGLHGGIEALTESLAKLTGGFISFEAIKEFGEAALEAAMATERWETGMKVLTGSAEETETILTALKSMALQVAVPFDDLLHTTQALIAKGMEFAEVTTLIQAAQDAAIATGNSFDQVATALERVFTTGQVSTRQLMQLGITWDQLAESMGVTVAEAQAAMKKGSQTALEDLADVEVALEKFKGAGAAATQDMTGRWQIFKNALTEDLDVVGKGLLKMADLWGQVATAVAVATGHLEMIPVALGQSVQPMSELARNAQELGAGYLLAGKNVGDFDEYQKKANEELHGAADRAKAAAEAAKLYAEEQKALQKALEDSAVAMGQIDRDVVGISDHWNAYNAAVADTGYKLTPLGTLIKGFESDLTKAYSHWLEIDDAGMKHVANLQAMIPLLEAQDKAEQDVAALLKTMVEQSQAFVKMIPAEEEGYQNLKTVVTALGEAVKAPAKATKDWDDALKNLGVTSDDVFRRSFGQGLQQMNMLIDSGRLSTEQLDQAWEHLISKFKNSAEAQQQILSLMQAEGAPLQLQLQAMNNIAAAQLKMAEYTDMTGKSELTISQHMTAIQAQQFILHQQTMGLADDWNNAVKSFTTAWNAVPKAFADAIVYGQDFGAAMKKILADLADQILTGIFKQAMNDMGASLLKNMGFLDGFEAKITKTIGKGGTFETAMDDSGESVKNFASTAKDSMQQAATAVRASASTMVADFNLIATAIGAIASIFAAIELAHTNTLLTRIEESTRRLDITAEGILAQAATVTIQMLPHLIDIWQQVGEIVNVRDLLGSIAADTTTMRALLEIIAVNGGGGSGGTGGGSLQALLTAMNSGFANLYYTMGHNNIAGTGAPVYTSSGLSQIINSVPSGSNIVPGVAAAAGSTYGGAGGGIQVSVPITVQGPVVGSGGMTQLANTVGNIVFDKFRLGGMKY